MFGRKSKSEQISDFVEVHMNSWSLAAAMDGLLSGGSPADGPTIIANEDFDRLILNASVYGAADSFGQSIGASMEETVEGIRKHLSSYSDGEDALREIVVAGTMPEFTDVVRWSGQCVYEIRVNKSDVAREYLQLFGKIKEKYA